MKTEEAKALYKTEFWKSLSNEEIATFQLFEDKLCMPFSVFHAAIEKVLGRPVYTHEFGLNHKGLEMELLGEKSPPTIEEIINLIPEDKRILISLQQ
jgi:hypothetical protein